MSKLNWIIACFIFIFGLYLGSLFISIPNLELDKKVDLIALGNLLLVATLSIFIPYYITDRLGNNRCAKDLLIEELAILCDKAEKVNVFLDSKSGKKFTEKDFTKTLSLLKSVKQHSNCFCEIAVNFKDNKLSSDTNELDEKIVKYWEVITGSKGIKKNSSYRLPPRLLWLEKQSYESVMRFARNLKFIINNQ